MASPRRKPASSALNSLFPLTLVMLGYLGAIGFGVVWLRHQISVTANSNKACEVRITEAQRRLAGVSAEIATATSPEELLRRNQEMGLNLVQPREEQVIRVRDDVERRLAAKGFGRYLASRADAGGAPPQQGDAQP